LADQISRGFTPRITPLIALNIAGRGRAAGQSNTLVHLRYARTPFLDYVEANSPDNILVAQDILSELATSGYSQSWASPTIAGLVSDGTVSATQIAAWLDDFRYSYHGPPNAAAATREYKVYNALEGMLGMSPGDLVLGPAAGRFTVNTPGIIHSKDPYLIAAYLRLWDHLTTGGATAKARILGDPNYAMDAVPQFKVAVAYGSQNTPMGGLTVDPNSVLPTKNNWNVERTINPSTHQLSSNWRGTSATYPSGDRFIDFDPRSKPWYSRGASTRPGGLSLDGVLVLHILNDGTSSTPPTITVGLSIPDGGPSAGFAF
jgi:hypothetical protein